MSHVMYEPCELTRTAERSWNRPFVQVRHFGELRAPSGRTFTIDGFHDGGSTWRVRFAPDEPGRWHWRTWSEPADNGLLGAGVIDVTAEGAAPGFLRASPGIGCGFAWSSGSPAYLLGDTMYNLFAYAHSGHDPGPLLERRLGQGMDWLRVRAHCSGYHRRPHRHSPWMVADVWPWGGVVQDPDFEEFNLRWFATLDRVIADCQRRGIALELILECWLFEFPFDDRHRFTAEDEELWIRYLVARYAAYRAVVMWTPGNEYVYYPSGEAPTSAWQQADTRPDRWIARLARLIRTIDPHGRPIAAHTMTLPVPTFAERLSGFPEIDTILFQEWGRRDALAWTADGIEEAIRSQLDGARQVCVFAEYGYESVEGLQTIPVRKHMDRGHTRRGAWRAAFHGMLVISGFENTWGPDMQLEPDAPGAADMIFMRRFFTEIAAFDRLRPVRDCVTGGRDDVPGAAPLAMQSSDETITAVYLPVGGAIIFSSTIQDSPLTWFDPRTGAMQQAEPAQDGTFVPPSGPASTDDWILVQPGGEPA